MATDPDMTEVLAALGRLREQDRALADEIRALGAGSVGTMMYGTANDAGHSDTLLKSKGQDVLSLTNGDTGTPLAATANGYVALYAFTEGGGAATAFNNGGAGSSIVAEKAAGIAGDVIQAKTVGVGNAIYGETSDIGQAVQGRATGQGYGVVGHTASDYASGVYGTTTGGGAGVQASSNSAAPALKGGSQLGRGAVLSSEAVAQLQLTPSDATTHPKHGERGDLFVDKKGHLWFCKKSGASATWAKLA